MKNPFTALRRALPTPVSAYDQKSAMLMLTPMMLVLGVVAVFPVLYSFWISLFDLKLTRPHRVPFVWFDNYRRIFADTLFWESTGRTVSFTVMSVLAIMVIATLMALLLNQEFKGRALVRTAVLVPWAIPTIVSAKMWGWMLNDQFGVINNLLVSAGLITHKIAWTAEPTYALWTVVLVDVWKTTPFMALLILAALQTVPKDCYEAARVDGVHPLRVFWRITLPLIRQPLMVAIIFRLLDSLRVFDLIYVLTANGSTTISMSGFVRREMVEYGNMGFGSAASTSLFLIIMLTAIIFLRLARVKLAEDAK